MDLIGGQNMMDAGGAQCTVSRFITSGVWSLSLTGNNKISRLWTVIKNIELLRGILMKINRYGHLWPQGYSASNQLI